MVKNNLKNGQISNGTHHRCRQEQCTFFLTKQFGSCRECQTCKAEPFIIKDDCKTCLDCEGVSGELRWDEKRGMKIAEKEPELNIEETPEQEEIIIVK